MRMANESGRGVEEGRGGCENPAICNVIPMQQRQGHRAIADNPQVPPDTPTACTTGRPRPSATRHVSRNMRPTRVERGLMHSKECCSKSRSWLKLMNRKQTISKKKWPAVLKPHAYVHVVQINNRKKHEHTRRDLHLMIIGRLFECMRVAPTCHSKGGQNSSTVK